MQSGLIIADLVKIHRDHDRYFELAIERFSLASGESIAVIGPSGSGKSTFLDITGLAAPPDRSGRFELINMEQGGTTDLASLWSRGAGEELAALRRRHFGYVMQGGGLLPFLSVLDNIELPQRLADRPDSAHINMLLERLDIAALADARPPQLSFGQRQRVAIARALAHRPAVLLADEPTAALDPDNARIVMELLLELSSLQTSSLIVVSHDRRLLDRLALPQIRISNRASSEGSHSELVHGH